MATYRKLLKNRAGDTIIPVVDVLNYLYPVGSIYMSATMSTAAQVEAAFGGTWTAWGAGRVPVGVNTSDTNFNTTEKTGGAATVTLTSSQIPAHKHKASMVGIWVKGNTGYGDFTGTRWNDIVTNGGTTYESYGPGTLTTQNNENAGGSHNNLQPYITCYMYKRTA